MHILIVACFSTRSTYHTIICLALHQMYLDDSADSIAAARSLQTFTFIYTSMVTFWMYDYACSFHEEWTFLLHSGWSRIKFLYVVTRYVPFLLFAAHLYMNFIPDETPDRCQLVNNICSCFSFISIICSECFFILRIYVLWNNNKVVLVAMLLTFIGAIVGSVVALFSATAAAPFATSSIPGITGCYQSSGSTGLFVPFLLFFVVELMLISLTLTCAIRTWRSNHGRVYAVLLKHNVFYYACGLFFTSVNILTSLLLHYAYSGMLEDFQVIIHAILATRMHLYLWHGDHPDRRYSDVFTSIRPPDQTPESYELP
ncbi:hypothetical protein M405DRAFT_381957 [Rhizopogon salebrosus TDB-379]|nr:hypothetical protein M405DRAFT_381957 [Rhizopogon salebrosus TDB-379]